MVQINPGKLEYASAVDLVESQSKLDSQIEASEQNVLNAIKQNDDDALDLLEDRYDQLGTLSKSLANAGKKISEIIIIPKKKKIEKIIFLIILSKTTSSLCAFVFF